MFRADFYSELIALYILKMRVLEFKAAILDLPPNHLVELQNAMVIRTANKQL